MSWGLVRVGERYAVLERLAGGVYRSRGAAAPGGRTYPPLLEGAPEVVLQRARTFEREHAARVEVAVSNRRGYDPSCDRWSHLDR